MSVEMWYNGSMSEVDEKEVVESVPKVAEPDYKAEATQRRHERNEARLEAAIAKRCVAQGIIDYDAAYALLDKSDIKFSDGQVEGLDKAFTEMVERRPYLKQKPTPTNTGGNPSSPATTGTGKYTKDQLGKMSMADINANWDKIQTQLKQGTL